MKNTRATEIAVGAFVALGMAALLMLAMKVSNLDELADRDGYTVIAGFDNIGGLKVRAPVKMGGVLVGRVSAIGYDAERYQATVELSIDRRFDRIPADTSANIYTAGLLGEQYIGLEPGADEAYLADGSRIMLTQSALVLEKALQQFLYSKAVQTD